MTSCTAVTVTTIDEDVAFCIFDRIIGFAFEKGFTYLQTAEISHNLD